MSRFPIHTLDSAPEASKPLLHVPTWLGRRFGRVGDVTEPRARVRSGRLV